VRLECLGKLKKFTSSGSRTGDLPACSIVPQPTTLPRAPHPVVIYVQKLLLYTHLRYKCTGRFGHQIEFHLLVCFLRKCLQAVVLPPVIGEPLVTYFSAGPDKTEPHLSNKTVPKAVVLCLAQIKRTYYI
jgi:hypothetical protein